MAIRRENPTRRPAGVRNRWGLQVSQYDGQWHPVSEAVNLMTSKGYDLDDAREILLEMLASGAMISMVKGNSFWFRHQDPEGITNIPLNGNRIIPVEFWRECAHPAAFKEMDWRNCAFTFDGRRVGVNNTYYGTAFEVLVDIAPVERAKEPTRTMPLRPIRSPDWKPQDSGKARGRPAANWWPDFAEELAMYCLMSDLPLGDGTEGQSEMLETVFQRMAERGKPEPSRSSVQPVINAVLRRFRSAGK